MHEIESQEQSQSWWSILAMFYKWRWFIGIFTVVMAIIAVIIALLLPVSFRSQASVILPSEGGGLASLLAGKNVAPVVSNILGGSTGDYNQFLAILYSREVLEQVVEKFNLEKVYQVEEENARRKREVCLELLVENLELEVDEEYDFLRIGAFDENPERAADIANYMVELLNTVFARLNTENASSYRGYVEKRYTDSQSRMDSLLNAQRTFQEKYGIVELPTQLETYYSAIAEYRLEVAQAEIQAETLKRQFGSENPTTKVAQDAYRLAQNNLNKFLNGQDRVMSVAQSELPVVARDYADLFLNIELETEIFRVLGPLYEQAKMEEEKQSIAVQVLDEAVPSAKKAWPPRAIIVIAATISAFLLCLVFVFLWEWWRMKHQQFTARLNQAIDNLN